MSVAPETLERLRCPKSKGTLLYFAAGIEGPGEFLLCAKSKLRYRIEDGLPIMLLSEAETVDDDTCARLVESVS